jgi:hypothetical protein
MEFSLTPRNQPNPLNMSFARPGLTMNPLYERYETQPTRFAPLQLSPHRGYALSLADKQLNAALPSTQQRFGTKINYDMDQRRKRNRATAVRRQEPYEMGLTRPGTGREPFQEIPYDFLDANTERYDNLGGRRLGSQTVQQAIRDRRSFGTEGFSITDGNTSISPQLLKELQMQGFEPFEILNYFNEFADRQKTKNLLLFIIALLLFGILTRA